MTNASEALRHLLIVALVAGFVMLMLMMGIGLGGLVLR